uniref:Uncharacterized protein n=1 Tax=Meloidogyne enterolobii TaxID=390850 RepID=A0A6V7XIF5_MELEN|nr:unnamed protein product [Meloidogyne enterolobii]
MKTLIIYLFLILSLKAISFYALYLTETEKEEFISISQFFESLIPKEEEIIQRPKIYGRISSLSRLPVRNTPNISCINYIEVCF